VLTHFSRSSACGARIVDIQAVIQDFVTCGHKLPKASMQWSLDHWDECGPHFLALLERFIRGEDKSREAVDTLLFALHLMGQKRERHAFEPLCALAANVNLFEELLGDDGATESLPCLLVSTFDGRIELLKALIEDATADEFVRHSALNALAYLTYRGDIAPQETRDYLRWLHHAMQPREENYAFAGIADAIINLGFVEDRPIVGDLLAKGLIADDIMEMRHFDEEIKTVLADPERRAGFDRDRTEPYTDVIGEMATWHWFTEAGEQEELEAQRHAQQTTAQKFEKILADPDAMPYGMVVDPLGLYKPTTPVAAASAKVGRNDPCPCGSGKKYKKCCLP
jgi:uncharacterized protein